MLKNKVALSITPKQSKPNNALVHMVATMVTQNKVVQKNRFLGNENLQKKKELQTGMKKNMYQLHMF